MFNRFKWVPSMSTINSCPVCGKYEASGEFISDTQDSRSPAHMLSAWIRDRNETGIKVPMLMQDLVATIEKSIRHYSPAEKQILLLQAIEKRTDAPGGGVSLNYDSDYPLAWAKNRDEFKYHIKSLDERSLINSDMQVNACTSQITPDGYDRLDKAQNESIFSDQCFVAMSFDDDIKPDWDDGFKPAIKDAGYKALRVDIEPHNENIVFKIIKEIRRSRFVVADLTGHRNAFTIRLAMLWAWASRLSGQ